MNGINRPPISVGNVPTATVKVVSLAYSSHSHGLYMEILVVATIVVGWVMKWLEAHN